MAKFERYTKEQIHKIDREWEMACTTINVDNPNPDCCVKCFFAGKGVCDVYPTDYDDAYFDNLVKLLAEFKDMIHNGTD